MVSFECNPMYVEDVENRSNTPKAVMLCMSKMSKMSKIDQIHLRAVMLCMSKMSKMGKEHTDTFWLITSLILNGFSIRKKFWKAETESFPTIPSNTVYIKACRRCQRCLSHLRHGSTYIGSDGMVGKLSVSAFQNFFRIENPLIIKEVISQNVSVCSFPIFDIRSITALRCI